MILLYSTLLISGNFVGNTVIQLFYFTISVGTLSIQWVYCGLFLFTEAVGYKKTIRLIWLTAFIHLLVGVVVYGILGHPIPDFWVNHRVMPLARDYQAMVALFFSFIYLCSALSIVTMAGWLKVWWKREWLFLRMIISVFFGLVVDLLTVMPIVFLLDQDKYTASWKIMSLITAKFYFSLFIFPICYVLANLLKMRYSNSHLERQI